MSRGQDRGERLFRLFLRLYPRTYRERFGAEMEDTFREERRGAAARGTGVFRFWVWILMDLVASAGRRRVAEPRSPSHGPGPKNDRLLRFRTFRVRDAVRALMAAPVITTVTVLSLALGIGANTAIFSVLDSLLLRNLPVRQPERLVQVYTGAERAVVTNGVWEQLRDRPALFDGAFAWFPTQLRITTNGESEHVDGVVVSGGFFDVLGVSTVLGRPLTFDDDVQGGGSGGPAAVISYGFWQERFGGSVDAIGESITLGSVPFRIVGITPPEFFGVEVGRRFDVAIPIATVRLLGGMRILLENPSVRWLRIMARVAPGQDARTAGARLRAVEAEIRAAADPASGARGFAQERLALEPAASGSSALRRDYARSLTVLMAIVALVLMIACANIANLLLARSAARQHELSVRLALGASRGSLVSQLLTESVLLSGAGALTGLLFAEWSSRLLVRQLTTAGARVSLDLPLDWRVLAFTAGLAVLTALVFGVAPALRATRAQPIETLRHRGRGVTEQGGLGWGGPLVIGQVALSVVLLTGGGLLLRTFASLTTLDPGFDRDPVLVVRVDADRARSDPQERLALFGEIARDAAALAGVERTAISLLTPVISGDAVALGMMVPGREAPPGDDHMVLANHVSAGWFATLGTPLLLGRDFDGRDAAGSPRVAIVNQAVVRQYFGGENPLGRTIRSAPSPGEPVADMQVIGVVKDVIAGSLREGPRPALYTPLAQLRQVPGTLDLSIRVRGIPAAQLARDVAAAVGALNEEVVLAFQPLRATINASLARERLLAILAGFFGVLALLLAGLGLYGLFSYAVACRRTEIGIRLALGSTPAAVAAFVLRDAGRLLMWGVLIGTAVALWVTRFLAALLYGLQPRDPATFVLATLTLVVVGGLAAWLPARRASRGDPTAVLRQL